MKIEKPIRNQSFTVTCTEEEKRSVYLKAQKSGRTVSGYIRWLIKQMEDMEDAENDRA